MKITSGSQDITRNILEDFEKLHGDKIKFQVRSDGVNLETVRIRTQEWTVENRIIKTANEAVFCEEEEMISK